LRLDGGNFSWGSEAVTRKTKILDVVYNATNNELVRTKTIVKNAIVSIDANPFRLWYLGKYDIELNKKKVEESDKARAEKKSSGHVKAKLKAAQKNRIELKESLTKQFDGGRILACISSRPGQSGRADGYILEGKELDFYLRKMDRKKK
jgi:small subunit ribosomal protein S8e